MKVTATVRGPPTEIFRFPSELKRHGSDREAQSRNAPREQAIVSPRRGSDKRASPFLL